MTACCPTCRQPVDPSQVYIDAERGLVVYQGRDATFTPQQMRLFSALWSSYPRVAAYDAILASLKGGHDARSGEKLVHVMLNHMRPAFKRLGMAVEVTKDVGYSLCLDAEAKAARDEQRSRAAGFRTGVPLARADIQHIADLRSRHYPAGDIARRTGLTYRAVAEAIDRLATEARGPSREASAA